MKSIAQDRHLAYPTAVEASLQRALGRPKVAAVICVVTLASTGWLYLGFAIAQMIDVNSVGGAAGMTFLELAAAGRWGDFGRLTLEALCLPTRGQAAFVPGGIAEFGLSTMIDCGLIFFMWCAMALAMMLPSAGPMILTYAEIAETAARKGEIVVSPRVLMAGFLAIWLGFALCLTLLQFGLMRAMLIDRHMALTTPLLSSGILLAAGAYQFSALKHACLTKCQQPLPFFFAHGSTIPKRIFRLGARQGLYCLGCCWAMMLIMFAVGVMNIAWMALVGIIMSIEKLLTTPGLSHAAGVGLMLGGATLIGSVAMGFWPA
jgi:predicted metal-binding membrane protein